MLVEKGKNLLRELQKNKVKINDACEGSLACGTCHVLVDDKTFQKLQKPSDKEEDLL